MAHLRSRSFERLHRHYRRDKLSSLEIENNRPRDFPLLTVGLASEAALQG